MSRLSKAPAVCGHRAGPVDAIVDENEIASKPPHKPKQASHRRSGQPIHGELAGSDRAMALGLSVQAHAPVLSLCRKLIEAGCDPARALHVFRHTILELAVRSIEEGARLTVKTAGNGCPIFALDAAWEGAAAPPERQNGSGQGKRGDPARCVLSAGSPRHDVRAMATGLCRAWCPAQPMLPREEAVGEASATVRHSGLNRDRWKSEVRECDGIRLLCRAAKQPFPSRGMRDSDRFGERL
jgi:hypothetical protein